MSSTQQWARETGETVHVERWNNTLRQRLARFVRMMLSFSKSVVMLRPPVGSSFSIATIASGPPCSSEPLPLSEEMTQLFRSGMWLRLQTFTPFLVTPLM